MLKEIDHGGEMARSGGAKVGGGKVSLEAADEAFARGNNCVGT